MSQYGLWEVPFASLYRIELDMLGTCLELLVGFGTIGSKNFKGKK
jgi:hypothetical protein